MRNIIMVFIILIGTLTQPAIAGSAEQILGEINTYRASQGLPPLKLDKTISQEAYEHSKAMAEGKVSFGHNGFQQRSEHLFSEFEPVKGMAENVAYTSRDQSALVQLWLHSRLHRKNIEGDYNLTGIGVATSPSGKIYATEIFVRT